METGVHPHTAWYFALWAPGRLPCLLGCPGRTQATSEAPFTFYKVDDARYTTYLPGSRGKRGWREALIPRDSEMKLINIDQKRGEK